MATSGSCSSNSYSGRYIQLNWSRTSYDVNGCYSDIAWSLVGAGTASASWYKAGNFKVVIDGETVYSSSTRINLYNGTTVASGTKRIYHNSDGTKSFSASIEAGIYYVAVNCTGSGSWTLDTIPRYLNSCKLYLKNTYLNVLQVNWTCDPKRDYTQYRIKTGSGNYGSWTDAGDTVAGDGKSGWFNIGNLKPNTSYTVQIRLRRSDSGLWSESNTITATTKNIATISSPNANFSLNSGSSGNSLKVTCSNPSGQPLYYYLDCPSGTRRLTSAQTTSTSYTWSAAQILSMLQYFTASNSSSIKVGVQTVPMSGFSNDSAYYNEKVGTLNVTDSNPTFSNFTYADVNSKTTALTGNNQYLVKGYSKVTVTISTANKAVAKNYASISKYRLVIGEQSVEANYSSSSAVTLTLNNVTSNTMYVYAIDSRGNSTVKQISASKFISYNKPVITSFTANRTNGVESETTVVIKGTWWNGNFGSVANAFDTKALYYKLITAGSYTKAQDVALTISGNNFTFNHTVYGDLRADGYTISSAFNLLFRIIDKLVTTDAYYTLGTGTPALAIHKNGVAIMNMYNTSLGGGLQVNNRVLDKAITQIGTCNDADSCIKPRNLSRRSKCK